MTSEQKIRKIAREARARLIKEGWTKGTLFAQGEGYCLAGAIRPFGIESNEMNEVEKRCARVIGHIPRRIGGLIVWNDSKGRKKHEVLAVLDAVIKGAGARKR